ncbi:MAG: Sulfotransferase domain [Rhodobacteraceae bacterium HLUCCA08]|nr:MAG: Sulfotransferase domain [Rhodobacteraceae bacterium HLUCCA08]
MTQAAPYDGPALVHVGYPKTASTFLQRRVFDRAELGFGLADGVSNRARLVAWFKTDDAYLQDPARISAEMTEAEAPVRARGLVPVWSEETLLGNPLQRIYDGAWVLDRLFRVAPRARVLITIRNQVDLALSAYREHLKLGRHSLRDFIGTGSEPRSYQPILREDYLKFDRAVAAYQAAFGPGNVCILPQEMLHRAPAAFFERLFRFTELPVQAMQSDQRLNAGLGGTGLRTARTLNAFIVRSPLSNRAPLAERLVRRATRLVDRVSPRALDRRIEAAWRAQIAMRYAGCFDASNARLAQFAGLDLSALGYPVAEDRA